MTKSKIETCEIKLAKTKNDLAKFLEEHNIDKVKTNRNILNYLHKLKDSEKDSYLSSKNVTLDICKNANKLFMKFKRMKKKQEQLQQELHNLTSVNNISPASVTTTFFSANPSSSQHIDTIKNKSIRNVDSQTHLNDVTKTLFVSDNIIALTRTPTIGKEVRRKFILSKDILSQIGENNTFDESIFICPECNSSIHNNQHSSSINQTNNNHNINNQVNTIVSIDQTYTDNINTSNTRNNNEFEDELSSSQDNTQQGLDINYDIEGYFCHNCHRNNTLDYFPLYKVQLSSLNRKKKFRFISTNNRNNQNEYIFLCKECLTFFSNENTSRNNIYKEYNLLWPSFV